MRVSLVIQSLLVALATSLGSSLGATAQETVDPRVFGLNMPPGPRQAGDGRRVMTRDEDGQGVLGQVHVQVGTNLIVMLPDGSLVARSGKDVTASERPFEAATKDALAEQLRRGPLKDFAVNQTRRYIYLYNTSEPFALATSRVMETMFPGVTSYAESQKIDVHSPLVPLVVIMFRTEAEFQSYRRMPPGVVAYYDPVSNHVVMYEQTRLGQVNAELGIQQSLSTIAHEGAHQILNNIGVQQRLSGWPMWLSEGLAEYFAPTSTGKRLRWKGAGQVNDLRMSELERYVEQRAGEEPNGELVEHTVLAARLTSTGYASAWALTHYLAKNRRAEFHRYVREISRLGPLQGSPPATSGTVPKNREVFEEIFGKDLTEMERRLVLHLKKQPYTDPFAAWPHFAAMVVAPTGRRTQRQAKLFHDPDAADKWRRELIESLDDDQQQRAQSAVRRFPNRPLAERFTRQWLQGS